MRRQAAFAGTFYPADPETLTTSVDAFISEGSAALGRDVIRTACPIVMLPHAGHVYCGRVIGKTLARAALPKRLIMLCPNHTGQGAALGVWPRGAWQTPLGDIDVDEELARQLLAAGSGFVPDTAAHMREHSIEVLLPFLQRLGFSSIVPVVVSASPQSLVSAAKGLGRVLAHTRDGHNPAGIVISSDMHHFSSDETTRALDELALQHLLAVEPEKLLETVVRNKISMCGVLPAVLALLAGRVLGLGRGRLVSHTTSAEASGDTSRVVGYAGVIFPA